MSGIVYWVGSIVLGMITVGLIALVYLIVSRSYRAVTRVIPVLSLGEKGIGIVFTVVMILLVIIAIFVLPPLIHSILGNEPTWVHDWIGPR